MIGSLTVDGGGSEAMKEAKLDDLCVHIRAGTVVYREVQGCPHKKAQLKRMVIYCMSCMEEIGYDSLCGIYKD